MTATTESTVHEAAFASQAAFRALMDCIARPGTQRTLSAIDATAPLAPAMAALVQSLCDYDSPVWLDPLFEAAPAVAEWIRFHTSAPIVRDPREAAFALIGSTVDLPDFSAFAQGSEEYPDRSTTLFIQVASLGGAALTLKGPGIQTTATFAAEPLPPDFTERMSANRDLFPRGLDLVFVAGDNIVALPRSVRIVETR